MVDSKHSKLFEPIKIGKVEIKNRIAMSPMNVHGLITLQGKNQDTHCMSQVLYQHLEATVIGCQYVGYIQIPMRFHYQRCLMSMVSG